VIRTRVGYTGGNMVNPTYYDIGDHSEAIQIDYDPRVISYEQLLAIFWQGHNPYSQAWSRQYKAAVFYHNAEQEQRARQSLQKIAAINGHKVYTEILPLTEFYRAEGYHQKYMLRHHPELMAHFEHTYPDDRDFVDSTAAARINSYLAGKGSASVLLKELESYGLPSNQREQVRGLVDYLNQNNGGGDACGAPLN